MKRLKFLKSSKRALAALALIAAVGCEDNEVTLSPDIRIDTAQELAMVQMKADEDTFYVGCTDNIMLFHVDGDQRKRLGKGGIANEDQWNGYFADDKLIAPIAGMGCDIRSCESLAGFSRDYSLRRYELVGQRTLTDAEKETFSGFPGSMAADKEPDTLSEYVSHPVHGTVEVEFTYLTSCDNHSDDANQKSHIEVITVP